MSNYSASCFTSRHYDDCDSPHPPRFGPGSAFVDQGGLLRVVGAANRTQVFGDLPDGVVVDHAWDIPGGFTGIYWGKPPVDLRWAISEWFLLENVNSGSDYAHGMMRMTDGVWTLWHEEVTDLSGQTVSSELSAGGSHRLATRASHDCMGRCAAVVLHPWICPGFFDVPVNEMAAQRLRVDSIFPSFSDSLHNRLIEVTTLGERLGILFDAVRDRVQPHKELELARQLACRIDACAASPVLGLAAIASDRSIRTVRRMGDLYLGASPKTYHGIRRCFRAVELLSGRIESLSGIACLAGYSDQAHMTRDFRKRIGTTPGKLCSLLSRSRRAGSFWFLPASVVAPDRVGSA